LTRYTVPHKWLKGIPSHTVRAHDAQDTGTQTVGKTERFPAMTTTLFDLIAALQVVVEPEEDAWVVATVVRWLRSGRIRLYDKGRLCPYGLLDEP
jgi:hypothetical protein